MRDNGQHEWRINIVRTGGVADDSASTDRAYDVEGSCYDIFCSSCREQKFKFFAMMDHVYQTRSLGVGSEGIPDQYADGRAAKVWEVYIGEREKRTDHYKKFLTSKLQSLGCNHVLDVACGTGIDSVLLLEEGFKVTSVDASDRMLKYALKIRWNRRKEKAFDDWVIEEANWLTLSEDLVKPAKGGFDAVICLGNSFSHLPDSRDAPGSTHRQAIANFWEMLRPGGYLVIDHRNYDHILDYGTTPTHSIYYNSDYIKDIQTSILYVNSKPNLVVLDYVMDVSSLKSKFDCTDSEYSKKGRLSGEPINNFRLSYYPHRLSDFTNLLEDVFGKEAHHEIYGDFKPPSKDYVPAFYIHIVQKA
ncbi:glycine N-methyltransferase [Amblyomma americanum]